jgi:hypothetical protein
MGSLKANTLKAAGISTSAANGSSNALFGDECGRVRTAHGYRLAARGANENN